VADIAGALPERLDQTIDLILARGDATAALADTELAPLAVLANDLRFCPAHAFKARLRANLERRSIISASLEAVDVREGFTTVTPYIQVREPGLVDFLAKVFAAVETSTRGPHGVRACAGDWMLMIGEGSEGTGACPRRSTSTPDVGCGVAALAARDIAWGAGGSAGWRAVWILEDPFGNHWFLATHLGPSPVPAGFQMVTPFVYASGAPSYIDFLTRALGAVEDFRHEQGGLVMHARIRIGSGAIEMGDAQGQRRSEHTAFYLYVPDVNTLYNRAVGAGAAAVGSGGPRTANAWRA
jgi:uncharacterized glyoxalase superfamily protein PhnB